MLFKLQTIKIGQIAHSYHLLLNFYNSDDTDFIIQLILITVICNYLSLHTYITENFFPVLLIYFKTNSIYKYA